MNLRNAFLLTLTFTCKILYSSEENNNNNFEHKRSVSSEKTSIQPIIQQPIQPSNFLTKAWYGSLKHVGGKTSYAIYMELLQNGQLQADFNNNAQEALGRLNETAAERFFKKDLLAADKQEKIHTLLTTSQEISPDFALAKALAAQYRILQQKAVNSILEQQAKELEPALRNKKRQAVKQAKIEYTQDLTKLFIHAQNAASNCRYLHNKAQATDEFNYQSENHYKDLTSYCALLESIQTTNAIETISTTNAADEAAYKKYSTSYQETDLA